MPLSWSTKGKLAKSIFYNNFNDIDIYVEDTALGVKKFYKEFFSRVFEGKYRIEAVFPLGDKHTVIQECIKNQNEGGRRRIYIVDGDLDLLTGNNPKMLKRFYALKRYSIENYLIDENAIIAILDEENIERSADDIKIDFDFSNWIKENEEPLFELFVIYAIAKELCPDLATVSYKINQLVSSNTGVIDISKIEDRKNSIQQEILKIISAKDLSDFKETILERVNSSGTKKIHYISGKDYIFPLLMMKMKSITHIRSDKKVIQQRLARKCDITELSECVGCLCD